MNNKTMYRVRLNPMTGELKRVYSVQPYMFCPDDYTIDCVAYTAEEAIEKAKNCFFGYLKGANEQ